MCNALSFRVITRLFIIIVFVSHCDSFRSLLCATCIRDQGNPGAFYFADCKIPMQLATCATINTKYSKLHMWPLAWVNIVVFQEQLRLYETTWEKLHATVGMQWILIIGAEMIGSGQQVEFFFYQPRVRMFPSFCCIQSRENLHQIWG